MTIKSKHYLEREVYVHHTTQTSFAQFFGCNAGIKSYNPKPIAYSTNRNAGTSKFLFREEFELIQMMTKETHD